MVCRRAVPRLVLRVPLPADVLDDVLAPNDGIPDGAVVVVRPGGHEGGQARRVERRQLCEELLDVVDVLDDIVRDDDIRRHAGRLREMRKGIEVAGDVMISAGSDMHAERFGVARRDVIDVRVYDRSKSGERGQHRHDARTTAVVHQHRFLWRTSTRAERIANDECVLLERAAQARQVVIAQVSAVVFGDREPGQIERAHTLLERGRGAGHALPDRRRERGGDARIAIAAHRTRMAGRARANPSTIRLPTATALSSTKESSYSMSTLRQVSRMNG